MMKQEVSDHQILFFLFSLFYSPLKAFEAGKNLQYSGLFHSFKQYYFSSQMVRAKKQLNTQALHKAV